MHDVTVWINHKKELFYNNPSYDELTYMFSYVQSQLLGPYLPIYKKILIDNERKKINFEMKRTKKLIEMIEAEHQEKHESKKSTDLQDVNSKIIQHIRTSKFPILLDLLIKTQNKLSFDSPQNNQILNKVTNKSQDSKFEEKIKPNCLKENIDDLDVTQSSFLINETKYGKIICERQSVIKHGRDYIFTQLHDSQMTPKINKQKNIVRSKLLQISSKSLKTNDRNKI